MVITNKLRERFCKDCNIPIKIFDEPYFTDRLRLYDEFYGTLEKWELFTHELEKYHSEQEYFEHYNKVKDDAIIFIKSSVGYQRFNCEDMTKFQIGHFCLPSNDIFRPSNHGKVFLSVDMRKANFSALQHYDNSIFDFANTWEEFIGKFTDNAHIMNSKYIRQVVLGNCNPKRQVAYEKYLMDNVIYNLDSSLTYNIISFSNDEIVVDITERDDYKLYKYLLGLDDLLNLQTELSEQAQIPLKVEVFKLFKIDGVNGYRKRVFSPGGECKTELKCVEPTKLPFVIRKLKGEEVTESDKVFCYEGYLAKFIDVPEINI